MLHNNLPRSFATSTTDGLMSKEDKQLLIKNSSEVKDLIEKTNKFITSERLEDAPIVDSSEWLRNRNGDYFYPKTSAANVLFGEDSDVDTKIAEVEDLAALALKTAQDKVSALVFDTKADLDTWLEDEEHKASVKIGTSFYIKDTSTPDYWWDGEGLQILETQKVDLTDYLTKTGEVGETTVTYTEDETLAEITSGSKLKVLFGAISKAIKDLISLKTKVGDTDISTHGTTVTGAIDSIGKNYLPLSGGTVTGNLTVSGVIYAKGSKMIISNISESGYWERGLNYVYGGRYIGEIGLHGTGSTILYGFIGENYDKPWLKVTPKSEVTATKFIGALAGNADTATKLATPRKIGEATFDGTADISVEDLGIKEMAWDNITGKPETFPPSDHTHPYYPNTGGELDGTIEIFDGNPHIDFHFSRNAYSHTSRIIETKSGTLSLQAKVQINDGPTMVYDATNKCLNFNFQ